MKTLKHKLLISFMAVVMAFSLLYTADTTAYAYNTETDGGVAVVVWYIKNANLYAIQGEDYAHVSTLGDMPMASGSGFFIGDTKENPEYLVTNYHVIAEYIENGKGGQGFMDAGTDENGIQYVATYDTSEMRVYYSETDYDVIYPEWYGGQFSDNELDLAVMKLKKPTAKRHALKLHEISEADRGSTVYVVGFPGAAENELTSGSKFKMEDISITTGIVGKLVSSGEAGIDLIQTDADISHGNSGGPMVNEKGNVIGINTYSIHHTGDSIIDVADVFYAINVSELINVLDKNGFYYELESSGLGIGTLIAIIVAAVVLAAVIVAVILLLKKKRAASNVSPQPAPSANMPQAPVSPTPSPATAGKPYIVSLAPQHAGASYEVTLGGIMIGRDPSTCKIVYAEGTPGVSGKHAKIEWDNATNEFIVTDLGSSYGTFVLGNRKLEVNVSVRLKAGDSLYLGEGTNSLRLEVR